MAGYTQIIVRRGLEEKLLDLANVSQGELLYSTDTHKLYTYDPDSDSIITLSSAAELPDGMVEFKQSFVQGTSYKKGNLVSIVDTNSDYCLYYCLSDTDTSPLVDSTNWLLFSKQHASNKIGNYLAELSNIKDGQYLAFDTATQTFIPRTFDLPNMGIVQKNYTVSTANTIVDFEVPKTIDQNRASIEVLKAEASTTISNESIRTFNDLNVSKYTFNNNFLEFDASSLKYTNHDYLFYGEEFKSLGEGEPSLYKVPITKNDRFSKIDSFFTPEYNQDGTLYGELSKLTNSGNYTVTLVNGEKIAVELIVFEENVTYTENTSPGSMATDGPMLVLHYKKNLTINSGVTITPKVRRKGMTLLVDGVLTNNGTISMTARGAKAVGQNVVLYKNKDNEYDIVPAVGASGAPQGGFINGLPGSNGISRKTGGGGGGGGCPGYSGGNSTAGSSGTSYSGGTGGGGTRVTSMGGAGTPNGGAGGNGGGFLNSSGGGGAGNPGGVAIATEGAVSGTSGTGGLLIIYSSKIINTGVVESKGSNGGRGGTKGNPAGSGGGGSGGGSINIFSGNFENSGSLLDAGGTGGARYSATNDRLGGNGGKGSTTVDLYSNLFCLIEKNNIVYYYDVDTESLVSLNKSSDEITKEDFDNHRFDINTMKTDCLEQLGWEFDFVVMSLNSVPSISSHYNLSPQMVVDTEDYSVAHIDFIGSSLFTQTVLNNADIKIVVSTDSGSTWQYFESNEWKTLSELTLENVLTHGNSTKTFAITNITSIPDIRNLNCIRFAYVLNADNIWELALSSIKMSYSTFSTWGRAAHNTDYKFTYLSPTKLQVRFITTGNYKVNTLKIREIFDEDFITEVPSTGKDGQRYMRVTNGWAPYEGTEYPIEMINGKTANSQRNVILTPDDVGTYDRQEIESRIESGSRLYKIPAKKFVDKVQTTYTNTRFHQAGCFVDNYFYSFAGFITAGTNICYKTDPLNNITENLANYPISTYAVASCNIGNFIYLAGGGTTATTYRYDIKTNTFTQLPYMPFAKLSYNTKDLIPYNGSLYFPGGFNGNVNYNSIFKYNILNMSWDLLPYEMPFAASNGTTFYKDGWFYSFGGRTEVGTSTAFGYQSFKFNIDTGESVILNDCPFSTRGAYIYIGDTFVYVFMGNRDLPTSTYVNDTWRYDIATDTWEFINSLTTQPRGFGAYYQKENVLVTISGTNGNFTDKITINEKIPLAYLGIGDTIQVNGGAIKTSDGTAIADNEIYTAVKKEVIYLDRNNSIDGGWVRVAQEGSLVTDDIESESTKSVKLSGAGKVEDKLTADLIVSPDNNAIQIKDDGVLVPNITVNTKKQDNTGKVELLPEDVDTYSQQTIDNKLKSNEKFFHFSSLPLYKYDRVAIGWNGYHTTIANIGDKIYSFGYYTTTASGLCYTADLKTATSETSHTGPVTFGRRVLVLDKDNIIVCGGNNVTNKLYKFNIPNKLYIELANLPTGVYCQNIVLYNNCLYVMGGYTGSVSITTIQRYDIGTNQWTTLSETLPTGILSACGIKIGNIYYIYGGASPTNNTNLYSFNLDTHEVKTLASGLFPAISAGVVPTRDGFTILSSAYTVKSQEYNIKDNTWKEISISGLPIRQYSGNTQAEDNPYKCIMLGGNTNGTTGWSDGGSVGIVTYNGATPIVRLKKGDKILADCKLVLEDGTTIEPLTEYTYNGIDMNVYIDGDLTFGWVLRNYDSIVDGTTLELANSITEAEIDLNGHLLIEHHEGTKEDLGRVTGDRGPEGKSAYEVWKEKTLASNAEAHVEFSDYLKALQIGTYELAVEKGFAGTREDFDKTIESIATLPTKKVCIDKVLVDEEVIVEGTDKILEVDFGDSILGEYEIYVTCTTTNSDVYLRFNNDANINYARSVRNNYNNTVQITALNEPYLLLASSKVSYDNVIAYGKLIIDGKVSPRYIGNMTGTGLYTNLIETGHYTGTITPATMSITFTANASYKIKVVKKYQEEAFLGKDGEDIFDIMKANGYSGTRDELVDSIKEFNNFLTEEKHLEFEGREIIKEAQLLNVVAEDIIIPINSTSAGIQKYYIDFIWKGTPAANAFPLLLINNDSVAANYRYSIIYNNSVSASLAAISSQLPYLGYVETTSISGSTRAEIIIENGKYPDIRTLVGNNRGTNTFYNVNYQYLKNDPVQYITLRIPTVANCQISYKVTKDIVVNKGYLKGEDGTNGKDYLDVAREDGFTGTREELDNRILNLVNTPSKEILVDKLILDKTFTSGQVEKTYLDFGEEIEGEYEITCISDSNCPNVFLRFNDDETPNYIEVLSQNNAATVSGAQSTLTGARLSHCDVNWSNSTITGTLIIDKNKQPALIVVWQKDGTGYNNIKSSTYYNGVRLPSKISIETSSTYTGKIKLLVHKKYQKEHLLGKDGQDFYDLMTTSKTREEVVDSIEQFNTFLSSDKHLEFTAKELVYSKTIVNPTAEDIIIPVDPNSTDIQQYHFSAVVNGAPTANLYTRIAVNGDTAVSNYRRAFLQHTTASAVGALQDTAEVPQLVYMESGVADCSSTATWIVKNKEFVGTSNTTIVSNRATTSRIMYQYEYIKKDLPVSYFLIRVPTAPGCTLTLTVHKDIVVNKGYLKGNDGINGKDYFDVATEKGFVGTRNDLDTKIESLSLLESKEILVDKVIFEKEIVTTTDPLEELIDFGEDIRGEYELQLASPNTTDSSVFLRLNKDSTNNYYRNFLHNNNAAITVNGSVYSGISLIEGTATWQRSLSVTNLFIDGIHNVRAFTKLSSSNTQYNNFYYVTNYNGATLPTQLSLHVSANAICRIKIIKKRQVEHLLGKDGVNGQDFYDVMVDKGYTGTRENVVEELGKIATFMESTEPNLSFTAKEKIYEFSGKVTENFNVPLQVPQEYLDGKSVKFIVEASIIGPATNVGTFYMRFNGDTNVANYPLYQLTNTSVSALSFAKNTAIPGLWLVTGNSLNSDSNSSSEIILNKKFYPCNNTQYSHFRDINNLSILRQYYTSKNQIENITLNWDGFVTGEATVEIKIYKEVEVTKSYIKGDRGLSFYEDWLIRNPTKTFNDLVQEYAFDTSGIIAPNLNFIKPTRLNTRRNGKWVYAQLFDCGMFPNNTNRLIAHNITDISFITFKDSTTGYYDVELDPTNSFMVIPKTIGNNENTNTLPWPVQFGGVAVSSTNIQLITNANLANYRAITCLTWTKETEIAQDTSVIESFKGTDFIKGRSFVPSVYLSPDASITYDKLELTGDAEKDVMIQEYIDHAASKGILPNEVFQRPTVIYPTNKDSDSYWSLVLPSDWDGTNITIDVQWRLLDKSKNIDTTWEMDCYLTKKSTVSHSNLTVNTSYDNSNICTSSFVLSHSGIVGYTLPLDFRLRMKEVTGSEVDKVYLLGVEIKYNVVQE